jgi:heat shock protein HtpX
MQYIGLQAQINRNNFRSSLLLIAFPALLLSLVWLFFFIISDAEDPGSLIWANDSFLEMIPFVLGVVVIWFCIAWFSHTSMIRKATGSKPLERKENKRVYNLVENLCMSRGMKNPKVNIINDDSLNAFASGINDNTYTVTLSRGIINKLNDEELEAVIAHELTHIQNRDVRLLIISIIFVGIFAFVSEMAFRSLRYSGRSRGKKGNQLMLLIGLLAFAGYLLSMLFRFALSRKREFLADAGAVEMTKRPNALASALRKISADPWIEAVKRQDVAQMFIDHPTKKKKKSMGISGLFATHPPIEERIAVLEQF